MRASRALRPSYRQAFGLSPGQKLVVVSSTWGPESLLGAAPGLLLRLAEQLPFDEFRILLAPHPNIVAGHSSWQFGEYTAAARRAGVTIPKDVDAWRTAIIAADIVVGDHGSVPFYSAALGIPLILATAPVESVDPRSPIAKLLDTAPRIDIRGDLATQIRDVIIDHDPDRYSPITTFTTSEPDASPANLRSLMYRTMKFPEPAEPAELSALPMPSQPLHAPHSYLAVVRSGRNRTASIIRYPAERLRSGYETPRGTYIVVGTTEPRRRWMQLADAVVGDPSSQTTAWIAETLAALPGSMLAAAPDEAGVWYLGDRTGTIVTATGDACHLPLVTPLACHHLAQSRPLSEFAGEWEIDCADRILVVTVRTVGHGSFASAQPDL
ncbi:hypothetical protein FNL39_104119 [Nocardia caishijiensis]|uniref:Uncharacterized protein n=2 Tax=Nocardia caishijiensis TaxID=184756 RepID=A0ABQ6YLP1_9NOCA|nr:hypothetical protein FNL39_104119 [Nocardia caishijiensis]